MGQRDGIAPDDCDHSFEIPQERNETIHVPSLRHTKAKEETNGAARTLLPNGRRPRVPPATKPTPTLGRRGTRTLTDVRGNRWCVPALSSLSETGVATHTSVYRTGLFSQTQSRLSLFEREASKEGRYLASPGKVQTCSTVDFYVLVFVDASERRY